ncbi:ATP-binding protein [Pontibacter aydingkolensis]|uniref:ATP-binding protein n=1 Tax=Pontibacter aydingkolensis TaxID=1911536 RepID=A0ABS7CUP1_9BACT|nr:ATP-binding protein [Pontibacter aydingkolensis]
MQQVLSNLIRNIIKYHDDPEHAVIRIKCEKHPDRLLFSVEDNGPGISQNISSIFLTCLSATCTISGKTVQALACLSLKR